MVTSRCFDETSHLTYTTTVIYYKQCTHICDTCTVCQATKNLCTGCSCLVEFLVRWTFICLFEHAFVYACSNMYVHKYTITCTNKQINLRN